MKIEHYSVTIRGKSYASEQTVLVARIGAHTIVYQELFGSGDRILINGTAFDDRDTEDLFASEMWGELTGSYPYQCEETIPVKRTTLARLASIVPEIES